MLTQMVIYESVCVRDNPVYVLIVILCTDLNADNCNRD